MTDGNAQLFVEHITVWLFVLMKIMYSMSRSAHGVKGNKAA